MTCMICLENIKENFIVADCDICNIKYHEDCYNQFKDKCNLNCPICRIKINRNIPRYNNTLFDYVFRLPAPLALFVWFIISYIVSLFIFPQLIAIHMFEHNKPFSIIVSIIHLYSVYWVYTILTI